MTVAFSPEMRRVQNHLRSKVGLELLPDPSTELFCAGCQQWKPDEEFYKCVENKGPSRRQRGTRCKACNNSKRREYRLKHLERENEKMNLRRAQRKREKNPENYKTCKCGESIFLPRFARHQGICPGNPNPVDMDLELWCYKCAEWKPDDEFNMSSRETSRRERHILCRVCQRKRGRKRRLDSQNADG